ncbi:MAG TPA: hypothetical protein VIF10_12465 [Methylobacter sp.]|jgi:hypothetical protein
MKLADDSITALFTIPKSDWMVISYRVGATIVADDANASGPISTILPDFPQLIPVCRNWNSVIFPGLLTYSEQLKTFAAQTVQELTSLNNTLTALNPAAPLPSSVIQNVIDTFSQINSSASNLYDAMSNLQPELNKFFNENAVINNEISSFQAAVTESIKTLGEKSPMFQFLFMQVAIDFDNTVDKAAGLAYGAWQAIIADLNDVISGKINITMPFLLSLDIGAAINSWETIQTEAAAFASMAAGTVPYSSGSKFASVNPFAVSMPISPPFTLAGLNYMSYIALQTEHPNS